MRRWQLWWGRVRDSLWFLPSIITVACAVLAITLVELEEHGLIGWVDDLDWVFAGGAAGAGGVLSAIASGLITVTGVTFSVTIVALQLASSQYSPRVLQGFIGDRVNQVVLGILIGTFTYALLVMRVIRSEADDRSGFVPSLAVTVGIVLLLVSIAALLSFISHAAGSIRVEVIVQRQVVRTRQQIAVMFPTAMGRAGQVPSALPVLPHTAPATISVLDGGYLQGMEVDAIFDLAREHGLTIEMQHGVGDFVLPDEAVARVWPADGLTDDVRDTVRRGLVFGHERTYDEDLEFGIIGLADIALRALSSSINDPTTAMLCIDRLAGLLVELARCARQSGVRRDDDGTVRLVMRLSDFDRAVDVAFSQVARAAAPESAVVIRLLRTLQRMGPLVAPEYRAVLARQAETTAAAAREVLTLAEDRAAVEVALGNALAWLS